MIAYLEGEVISAAANGVVVKTVSGVGYLVLLPAPLLAQGMTPGRRVEFHVSTQVREGEMTLYGFAEPDHRRLFELLQKASGVGPKAALGLLSALSPSVLIDAIRREDLARLSSVPGIGKKTASRICLDLKDRLKDWDSPAGVPGGDLASALTNLGYHEKDIYSVLSRIPAEAEGFSDQLRHALRLLSKG
ncbi:MAG: Holliday junction branch migration protein RuvA [Deltaproteobacteria bacterium]|nr:Holliday junction branch migration protein RuvA [Deltaproteobacteria bacterium]